jgi:hypothetical protein
VDDGHADPAPGEADGETTFTDFDLKDERTF